MPKWADSCDGPHNKTLHTQDGTSIITLPNYPINKGRGVLSFAIPLEK